MRKVRAVKGKVSYSPLKLYFDQFFIGRQGKLHGVGCSGNQKRTLICNAIAVAHLHHAIATGGYRYGVILCGLPVEVGRNSELLHTFWLVRLKTILTAGGECHSNKQAYQNYYSNHGFIK